MTIRLTAKQKIKILNEDDVFRIMQEVLMREKKIDRNKEHLWLVCLSNSNQVLMIELISLGTVKSTFVEPMDVFSFALQKRAVKIIMVHNHPSGELIPSRSDIKVTERMAAIGHLVDVPVVDHMIISEKDYFSFRASGLLEKIERESRIDLTFKKQEAQAREVEEKLLALKIKSAKKLLKQGMSLPNVIALFELTAREAEALIPKKKKK